MPDQHADTERSVSVLRWWWSYSTLGPNPESHTEVWADMASALRRRDWLLGNEFRIQGQMIPWGTPADQMPPPIKLPPAIEIEEHTVRSPDA